MFKIKHWQVKCAYCKAKTMMGTEEEGEVYPFTEAKREGWKLIATTEGKVWNIVAKCPRCIERGVRDD